MIAHSCESRGPIGFKLFHNITKFFSKKKERELKNIFSSRKVLTFLKWVNKEALNQTCV